MQTPTPSIIYKFIPSKPSSQKEDFLDNHCLRATPPSELNDPFECLGFVNRENLSWKASLPIQEEIRRIKNEPILNPAKIQNLIDRLLVRQTLRSEPFNKENIEATERAMAEQLLHATSQKFGMISFTSDWKYSSMWAHYASEHHGYCVGFRSDHEFFSGSRKGLEKLDWVEYRSDKIEIDFSTGKGADKSIMLRKASNWEHERELRLIVAFEEFSRLKKIERLPPEFPINLCAIPYRAIAEVIVGVRADKETVQRAQSFVRMTPGVKLYQAKLSVRTFDLDRDEAPFPA